MADRTTPNLLSGDFDRTASFYGQLGFECRFRSDGWMVLDRGGCVIEFVPLSVDPAENLCSCCLWVDDLDRLHQAFSAAVPAGEGPEHVTERLDSEWGRPGFALMDPDGNLIRCLQN